MIKEYDGENFEDMRSLNQELTFDTATKIFEMRNLELGSTQMKTLGMVNDNNVYTNLALLLSDQCPHIIKVAVFRGTDMFNFQDRQEFSGSLFSQLDDAYRYLNMANRTRATFNGLYRQDYRDYPEAALREALINSIVHKEYSRSVDTKISFFADRVEFISYGGIYGDESMESVLNGLSICRNPKLANIFYRLKMIEAYGTGLRKIIQCYDNTQINPEFFSTSGMFKVTLPSIIYHEECEECLSNNTVHEESVPYIITENNQYKQILALTARKGHITRPEVQQILGVSLSTANRMLKSLQKDGRLSCVGNGKNTHYTIST